MAVTERSALIVTEHVEEVPEHVPPDHPAKRHPEDAVAVRVTELPVSYVTEEVDGVLMETALSDELTEPPVPTWVTDST